MYLSKQHIQSVFKVMNQGQLDDDSSKIEQEITDLRNNYENYVQRYGLDKTPSRKRMQGEDISLMTEIALTSKVSNLYPAAADMEPTAAPGLKSLRVLSFT